MSKWVPVSKRLPDKAGEYIVTYHPCLWGNVDNDALEVGMSWFRGKSAWAKEQYWEVVAWQEKPAPYQEGNDE